MALLAGLQYQRLYNLNARKHYQGIEGRVILVSLLLVSPSLEDYYSDLPAVNPSSQVLSTPL